MANANILFKEGTKLFKKNRSESTRKLSEIVMIKILEYLIDHIFAMSRGRVFQQIVDMLIGTNCAPLLVGLFLYTYEADFM